MSVNSKMTAIADPIRALMGKTEKMGLDAMADDLGTAVNECDSQASLIQQIKEELRGKTAGGGTGTPETWTFTMEDDSTVEKVVYVDA